MDRLSSVFTYLKDSPMLTAGLGLMAAILLFCVAGPLFVDTDADILEGAKK